MSEVGKKKKEIKESRTKIERNSESIKEQLSYIRMDIVRKIILQEYPALDSLLNRIEGENNNTEHLTNCERTDSLVLIEYILRKKNQQLENNILTLKKIIEN